MKTCSKCGVEKPLEGFNRQSRSRDGRKPRCRDCTHIEDAAYRAANPERVREQHSRFYGRYKNRELPDDLPDTKVCSKCRVKRSVSEFHRRSTARDGLTSNCAACRSEHAKDYYIENRDEIQRKHVVYAIAHREERAAYHKRRYDANPEYFAALNKKRKDEWRMFLEWLKLGFDNRCLDCGEQFEPSNLHFDHLPERGEKLFDVSRGWAYKQMVALAEIPKCEIVCASCHGNRGVARGQITFGRDPKVREPV